MKCSQAHKRISEYIDGLLDESAVHQLEAHLEKCENCSGLLAEMTSLVKNARQMEKVQPSEGVWLSIRKGLIQKEQKTRTKQTQISEFFNFIKYPRGLAIASSAFLVIIISTFIFYYGLPFLTNDPNDPMKVAHHHFEEAEKHYQIAINSLKQNISDYEAKLPPELAAV
ncbi:MAG: zf-HC2 domain-containing protein, partial [Deltaproteobacteria bacterium]|nr:zf-HC2 domain-containing protein [Deltaproteobacteria bacterium]